jgi:3-oxoacyl-[acyl-carrier protein] reductase
MKGIKDKSVLVTGAARGIGRATASRFHSEGAHLILVDLPPLEKTELDTEFPERMTYVQADLTQPSGITALVQVMEKEGVDVVVNNAGITRDASALKLEMADWDAVLNVNLKAAFEVAREAAQIMKAQGRGGAILNAASVVAHYGNFGQANYVASKAGLIGLTKTLAREWGRYGIRVNAVAPGFVDTEMARAVPEKVLLGMKEKTPMGRLGDPKEIAAAYAFLASDDAAFITGTCLNVDGGLVIG